MHTCIGAEHPGRSWDYVDAVGGQVSTTGHLIPWCPRQLPAQGNHAHDLAHQVPVSSSPRLSPLGLESELNERAGVASVHRAIGQVG